MPAPPSNKAALLSGFLLVACLAVVVLLAKALGPSIEAGVAAIGAPTALVGVIIAAVVLFPEGLAALRAARADRLQTSLNLALGSALASIGLTIPAVAIVSLATGWRAHARHRHQVDRAAAAGAFRDGDFAGNRPHDRPAGHGASRDFRDVSFHHRRPLNVGAAIARMRIAIVGPFPP